MTRSLILSLCGNLVLVAIVGLLWQWPHGEEMAVTTQAGNAPEVDAKQQASAPLTVGKAAFHWRQVEAEDFPTFVANLRAIGCPESTIRDIVNGELRLIMAEKVAAQASPQANVNQPVFNQLEAERLALVEHLLQPHASPQSLPASASGMASADSTGSTSAAPAAPATASSAPTLTEITPAAFLVGDAEGGISDGQLSTVVTDTRLSPEDADQLNRLRKDFGAAVLPDGPSAASPDSREYIRRWRRAQQESDDRFSSLYGGDALNALHRQQLLQASQASAPSGK